MGLHFIAIVLILIGALIKNFSYKFSWHYNLGRALLAGFLIFFGYNIYL